MQDEYSYVGSDVSLKEKCKPVIVVNLQILVMHETFEVTHDLPKTHL